MWSKKFGIDFNFFNNNSQRIIYHTKERWKKSYWMITCKTYILDLMKFIYIKKGVMDNNYNCN